MSLPEPEGKYAMRLHGYRAPLAAVFALALSVTTLAQDGENGSTRRASTEPAAAPPPSGILPLVDYSGSLFERPFLLGHLGGSRPDWAADGISFDIDFVQYFQSVVDGGRDTSSHYGGTIDYNLNLDLDRMGVIPGGLLSARVVSRYGRSVNGSSGAAIPVNTSATTPTTAEMDDDVTYLPVINYTQFLSKTVAVAVGKFDTYSQSNEFKGGSGKSQFLNLNLAAPTSPALLVPYSVFGASVLINPTPDLAITAMVATSTDTSDKSGFGQLDEGMFALLKVSYQYELGDLPGGVCNQFGYGWDNDFIRLNGRLNLEDLTPATKNNSWFNSFDFWQYVWVEDDAEQRVNINDGQQDLQGIGVFSRIEFTDADTNPLDYSVSIGVSAKGLFPNRDNDTAGIGFAYNKLDLGRLPNTIGIDDSSSVLEAYYNIEITPAMHLTMDAQVSDSALPGTDTAVILGARMRIRF